MVPLPAQNPNILETTPMSNALDFANIPSAALAALFPAQQGAAAPAAAPVAQAAPVAAQATPPAAEGEKKKKGKLWLNVGMDLPMTNPTTGEVEMVFVSLPFGLTVDTMDDIEIKGQNLGFNQLQEAKNGLKAYLTQHIGNMPVGAEEISPILKVQYRHAGKAPATAASGANPFLAAMAAMLAPKPAA